MSFVRILENLRNLNTKVGATYKRACATTYEVYPEPVRNKLKASARYYANPSKWDEEFTTEQAQDYMRHYEQSHEETWFLYAELRAAETEDNVELRQSDRFWIVSVNLKANLMAKEGLTQEEMKEDTKVAVSEAHVKEVVQIMSKRELFWCFAPVAFCCPIGNNLVKMAPVNNRDSLRNFVSLLRSASRWYFI